MTFDDEFQARLDQLDNILGPLQDIPAERLDQLRRDYTRDRHEQHQEQP